MTRIIIHGKREIATMTVRINRLVKSK